MIAVDTNLLVYAQREDSPWHDAALTKITELAEAKSPWSIPWPCIHEFLAIVAHPRIYSPPTPLAAAHRRQSARGVIFTGRLFSREACVRVRPPARAP